MDFQTSLLDPYLQEKILHKLIHNITLHNSYLRTSYKMVAFCKVLHTIFSIISTELIKIDDFVTCCYYKRRQITFDMLSISFHQ